MYPRLYIAKQLLKDDGVVFISIDDNEVAQLSLLMDEIFGEENNEIITWKKIDPKYDKNTNAKIINRTKRIHEFILVGYSNKEETSFGKIKKLPQWKNKYKNMDNDPRGSYKQGIISFEEGHKKEDKNSEYYYTITLPSGRKMTRHFFVLKEEFEELVKDNRIYFPKNGDGVPALKIFENEKKEFYFDTILEGFGSMNSAKKEIAKIFEVDEKNVPFKTPKPTELLLEIIRAVASKNDIILDFFAGSGTTGDAVMKLNAEDGGNRKYILAQLPEVIDKKKKENKIAYDFVKNELNVENPTIFDITKERLIRAANKIKTENINNKITEKQKEIKELEGKLDLENKTKKINKIKDEIIALKNQDLGFKIFETIPNNEGKWENYVLKLEKFDPHQKLLDEYKLNKEDLKTLLTTWKTFDGFSLTQNLKEIDFDGYKGHYLDNKLYLVYKGFETRHLKKLLEEIDENRDFYPATIIAFGYNFESKMLREIEDNIKIYKNKKQIDIDFIVRY
jgi:adenine-specific DNA-methyltransferase